MSTFESLTASLQTVPTPQARVETLLRLLAQRIKTTSNDQNCQRLARDLAAAASDLARTALAEAPAA